MAITHDYLTQRGGAERVVLDIAGAFPGAQIYTSLYEPARTFPEFSALSPKTSELNRIAAFRRNHRLAFPVLAFALSQMAVDADVTIASTSGWAHGIRTSGRKIVYCHAPARWLYQTSTYLGSSKDGRDLRGRLEHALATRMIRLLGAPLQRWDSRAASTADVYLANSTVTQRAIAAAYGIDAQILPPPPAMLPDGTNTPFPNTDPGFYLCVARLLPYKNVDVVIEAIHSIRGARLVVVGTGPDHHHLQRLAESLNRTDRGGARIVLAGRVPDDQLRWLYSNSSALVAASIEDYGLTPLEAAAFGKPTVALAAGGYLDTVIAGTTGQMFAAPEPLLVARAVQECAANDWNTDVLIAHAERFSTPRFQSSLRKIVAEVCVG